MTELIHEHWTKGGTGVTNFPPGDRPKYQAAIDSFGDSDLVICDKPFGMFVMGGDMSLHCLGRSKDLSKFWSIFHAL